MNCKSESQSSSLVIKLITFCSVLVIAQGVHGQVPTISYSGGPYTYTVGSTIPALTPTVTGSPVTNGQTTTLAGTVGVAGYADGTGTAAKFSNPIGMATDASGNIYLADESSCRIRKITPAGVVTTIAGNGTAGYVDGNGTSAEFYAPFGICVDAAGYLYVADYFNNVIRKITPTGIVSTVAGNGTQGYVDGNASSAEFNRPTGVAVDGSGNLFVSDFGNSAIRKITPGGVVSTFAGGTPGYADGTGTAAKFSGPQIAEFDPSGNLIVADKVNNVIRKITSAAVVTTLAGTPTVAGYVNGSAGTAKFNYPAAVSVDGSGNIYVADFNNNCIRMITPTGTVSTLSGTTAVGSNNGLGPVATFNTPYGLAVDGGGNLNVSDFGNQLIRKVISTAYTISPALPAGFIFNTATGVISGSPAALMATTNYTVTAYNSSGSGTATLSITVVNPPVDPGNHGFVQTENIKVAGITVDSMIYPLSNVQKQTSRTYLDGLGRPIQGIAVQASPAGNDLIQPMAYDALGRPVAGYLPYAGQSTDISGSYRSNALTSGQGLSQFYNQTTQYIIPVDTAPHANVTYEKSPLQRLLQSGMVGSGYQPEDSGTQYYKTVSYRYNTSGDGNIIIWVPSATGTFTTDGNYAVSTLSVTDGKDEDGTETLTFTDRSGHLILKRQILSPTNLDTYYLYNMAGMLSYVIPPQATNVLGANSYNLTAVPLSNMVFYYTYNAFGQIVSRKVPAKGTMNIIYDPLHRPVLSQDANMAANYQWNFIKYDVKGRAIESGVYTDTNTGRNSVSGMQSYVSGLSYTTWYESRTSVLTSGGYYTNTVFPVTGTSITLTPLSYSYYDDYFMTEGTLADFSYASQGMTGEESQTTAKVKGMPTMTSMTTVGSGLTSTWLTKATFYDHRLNPIQTQSNNHVYYTSQTTITDYATVVPDFVGVPQQTYVTKKTATSTTIQVLTAFSYDAMYRIKNVSQAYNGGPTATVTQVAAYSYNEVGQSIKKSLGYVNSTTWLQNVDMRYNIRGQLLSINNSTLTSDGGITNSDTNDAFGAVYLYDQADGNLSNSAYHNGKLSAVKWMSTDGSGTKTKERAFLYSYDGVNRYTASTYEERVTAGTGAFNNNVHGFDEYGITYDLDGNIKTLKRNSSTQGTNTHIQIDSLNYMYSSSTIPDQLYTVTDGTGANYTGAGFRNLTNSSANYQYDSNGNLTLDPYKGLNISYDYLNRTDKITVTTSTNRYIYYTYNAAGQLIRKQAYDNAVLQTTTDYVDGFVYITTSGTTAISYFPMPEGRVVNTNPGGTLTLVQEYIITDQQGNARVSFRNVSGAAVVQQENSYYGFGLILQNSPVGPSSPPNKQLYNGGSEWQSDYPGTGNNMPDYYETYYRNYDAALARWVAVDPMAEGAESMSVYQYSGNNPIMFNDPLGNATTTNQLSLPGSHNSQSNYVSQGSGDDWDSWNGGGGNYGGAPDVWGQAWGADFGNTMNYGWGFHSISDIADAVYYILSNGNYGGRATGPNPDNITLFSNGQEEINAGYADLQAAGLSATNPLPGVIATSLANAYDNYNNSPLRTGRQIFVTAGLDKGDNDMSIALANGGGNTNWFNHGVGETVYDASGVAGTFANSHDVLINGLEKASEDNIERFDLATTITTIFKVGGEKSGLVSFTGTAFFKVLGRVTGIASVAEHFYKGAVEIRNGNKLLGGFHMLEGVGQGLFMIFGGETVNLGYGLGTLGLDMLIEHNKK